MAHKHPNYLWRIFIALDQLANTILGGDEDETISSRIGKIVEGRNNCWICRIICNLLNKIDQNHCKEAIEPDEGLDR